MQIKETIKSDIFKTILFVYSAVTNFKGVLDLEDKVKL